jgi:two-component system nitrogen regulation response regulator GlnG
MIPSVERLLSMQSPPEAAPIAPPEARSPDSAPAGAAVARRRPADVTEPELREALRASRWDLAAAAARLGISRASMYLVIERLPGFRAATDLEVEEIVRWSRELGGDRAKMAERLEVSERGLARRMRELGLLPG